MYGLMYKDLAQEPTLVPGWGSCRIRKEWKGQFEDFRAQPPIPYGERFTLRTTYATQSIFINTDVNRWCEPYTIYSNPIGFLNVLGLSVLLKTLDYGLVYTIMK